MGCMSPEGRFWAKVEKTDGCWLWRGAINSSGYGSLTYKGSWRSAHRVAWAIDRGGFIRDLCVLHRCDVRNCVRPDHLFAGTKQDNTLDMFVKGRAPRLRGEQHPNARITNSDVVDIRSLKAFGASAADLANAFDVCKSVIWRVCNGTFWRHV